MWFTAKPAMEAAMASTKPDVKFLGVVKAFNPTLRELLVGDALIRFCERLPVCQSRKDVALQTRRPMSQHTPLQARCYDEFKPL